MLFLWDPLLGFWSGRKLTSKFIFVEWVVEVDLLQGKTILLVQTSGGRWSKGSKIVEVALPGKSLTHFPPTFLIFLGNSLIRGHLA